MFRRQGARGLVQKVVLRAFPFILDRPTLVHREDVLAADWRAPHPWRARPRALPAGSLTIAWVMSPPGANSGGHQNIFRFLRFLEEAGHAVRIYIYSAIDPTTAAESRRLLAGSSSFARVGATIEPYPERGVPSDVDVLIATGWETAYRSYRDPSDAKRLYFVQDFEPLFYPMSSEAVLAENTYRFGFIGITAGAWLAAKLRDSYGMATTAISFGADPTHYRITNSSRRAGVLFYARPETPRRGFELGSMALELFARERPSSPILLAGQHLRSLRLPFAFTGLGNVQVAELNAVYNQCAAGLVLSLTNMSLLPLELLAAGVIPVLNDGPNNRLVSSNPYLEYADPSPQALAERLIAVIDRHDQQEHAQRAAASVEGIDWNVAGKQFVAAVERAARG